MNDIERDEKARAAFLKATERVITIEGEPRVLVTEFVPGPPRPAPPPQTWPYASIVRRSIAGDDEDVTRRRPSMAGFLAAMAASFDWGVPVRSSGDPGRYGGGIGAGGGGKAPAATTAREEYALAVRELQRVAESLPPKTIASGHVFDGPSQLAMWSVCHGAGALTMHVIKGGKVRTKPGYAPPKVAVQRVPERHQVSATQYAGDDPDYRGPTLRQLGIIATPHEVGLICRGVTAKVEAAFVARGWVRARRKSHVVEVEGSTMAMPDGYDLDGWKDIAPIVGYGVDTCREYAERSDDPLPTYQFGKRVLAKRAEVVAWMGRQVQPRARRSA